MYHYQFIFQQALNCHKLTCYHPWLCKFISWSLSPRAPKLIHGTTPIRFVRRKATKFSSRDYYAGQERPPLSSSPTLVVLLEGDPLGWCYHLIGKLPFWIELVRFNILMKCFDLVGEIGPFWLAPIFPKPFPLCGWLLGGFNGQDFIVLSDGSKTARNKAPVTVDAATSPTQKKNTRKRTREERQS
ncbi:hypothetical protein AXF42_Ash016660 [Apostasia shenzhenica]|uniref:Uncharacterized protein n=1 Tax=Apostasia shenzhenica TaxID=1088818 RepID=A0A2I0A1P4_9ASPA|nr:hypothetical protein AXF42_Ash016660 [Apostasia shenzhenica]